MAVAATEPAALRQGSPGLWRLTGWGPSWLMAGILGPPAEPSQLIPHLPGTQRVVQAEQVHGSSIAVIQHADEGAGPVAGCDALLTSLPRTALVIRTADCLPLAVVDPVRRVIGIAHAGWRGLVAGLPLKLLAAFRHTYHSRPAQLCVAIGPAIHACCYEVGPEFESRFGSFVRVRGNRRTCDLIELAINQFRRGGVTAASIADSQQCTACGSGPWYSIRRDGQATGRLLSFIAIR